MMFEVARRLRHASYWLLRHQRDQLVMDRSIARFGPALDVLYPLLPELLPARTGERYAGRIEEFIEHGVTPDVGERLAGLAWTTALLDITDIANGNINALEPSARVYFEVDRRLAIDWLRRAIDALGATSRWQAIARSKLRDTVNDAHTLLARQILPDARRKDPQDAVENWFSANNGAAFRSTLRAIRQGGKADFATLSVAVGELRSLTTEGQS